MAAKKKEAPAKPAAAKPAKAAKAEAPAATSKFATFLTTKKLDPRRVLVASKQLETLQREDRSIKLAKRRAKAGGEAPAAAEGAEAKKPEPPRKPRSGRPVTRRALNAAMAGGAISGPVKTRILRAVNYLLEQKKTEKVDLKALF